MMVPTHSTSIDLSVWHKEITGREVVAHAYFDFNAVAAMPGKPPGGEKRCACVIYLHLARIMNYTVPNWDTDATCFKQVAWCLSMQHEHHGYIFLKGESSEHYLA